MRSTSSRVSAAPDRGVLDACFNTSFAIAGPAPMQSDAGTYAARFWVSNGIANGRRVDLRQWRAYIGVITDADGKGRAAPRAPPERV